MRKHGRCRGFYVLAAGLLLLLCGCNTTLTSLLCNDPTVTPGPPRPTDPAPVQQAIYHPAQDQAVYLSERLAASEDERKVLASRMQVLENLLQEREQALELALKEIEAAREAITRARTDLERWRMELEALRERSQRREKEDRQLMDNLMKMLEKYLEPER